MGCGGVSRLAFTYHVLTFGLCIFALFIRFPSSSDKTPPLIIIVRLRSRVTISLHPLSLFAIPPRILASNIPAKPSKPCSFTPPDGGRRRAWSLVNEPPPDRWCPGRPERKRSALSTSVSSRATRPPPRLALPPRLLRRSPTLRPRPRRPASPMPVPALLRRPVVPRPLLLEAEAAEAVVS